MKKILYLSILSLLSLSAGIFAFADQPNSSLDDKPSVDSAANSQVQAPALPSGANASDTQSTYLYDLKKLIDKSRENIKEVNEKIKEQAVLKRNQKREERAREYYEKGVELTNEGKLDQARDYFEKAIRITEHPEMAGYIKESQRRLRKQEAALQAQERDHYHQIKQAENVRKEDVEAAYREAVDLYKQKKYHPAKDAFMHVDEIAPDYRATESYLKIIDQDIVVADAVAAKQQAVEVERQQKEAEVARAKEKQMWLAQIEEKEKERKEAIKAQAEEVYGQAVELYKKKEFAESKKKFEEVSWVIPDYKATMNYLARIDHDAEKEKERVALEQKKALEEQRWEDEVQKKKQEASRQKELEAKERQHLKDLQEQAQFLYTAAVHLFDQKKMDEALDQFNDIEKLVPEYKSTRVYIARIVQWEADHQKKGPAGQQAMQYQQNLTDQQRHAQELKSMTDKAQQIYGQALDAYKAHQWVQSRAQFETVEQMLPDFKDTRRYLRKTDDLIAKEHPAEAAVGTIGTETQSPAPSQAQPAIAPSPVTPSPSTQAGSMPPQVKVAISLEDQQKQAQEIAALAEKSAQLYHQIADIANDRSTVQTKKKMAQVDEILNNLKENKEHLLRQMEKDQFRQLQEQQRAQEQERRAKAEKIYQDALESLRSHEYAKAKIKFMELENFLPDYKATHRYLKRVEEGLRKANVEAVTNYEKTQAKNLVILQNKENAVEMQRDKEEEQKQQQIQQQQQAELQSLSQKASDINDDIISLSKTQDIAAMKAKFAELENTVTALTTLKDEMAKTKDSQDRNKQLAHEAYDQHREMLRAQKLEDEQIHAYYTAQPLKEYRPALSIQPDNAQQFKRREIVQEQNALFSEGVDRYEHKKYTQAKLLFGELAQQHDRRAEAWLKKVDRAITRELLRSQEAEERERTAFIADQVQAQRKLIVIQERERQRQKKLTEELERQKRFYEDDRLLQLRKEELMKTQERERQRQEVKRLKKEEESQKQQESLRFHKIKTVIKAQPAVGVSAVVAPAAVNSSVAHPATLTPEQLKAQINFSNERKDFLDKKYKKEQEEKDRQARIKAKEDARQKRIEERQKLKAQREAARQAKIKAVEDAKAAAVKAKADKIAQEKKQREDLLRKQEEERQEHQRQGQLEMKREEVRKQLEDGVEAMYQDALSLYKQGEFTAAAQRFKDVQDILPGYKQTEQYLDQARQKTISGTSSADRESVQAPASTSVSRQEGITKALDLFDSNVK